jgi:hypothetical protein
VRLLLLLWFVVVAVVDIGRNISVVGTLVTLRCTMNGAADCKLLPSALACKQQLIWRVSCVCGAPTTEHACKKPCGALGQPTIASTIFSANCKACDE